MLIESSQDGLLEKWAKYEYAELKERVWLEPAQAVLRRTTFEAWTDKHRHATRKLAVEGGWVQKRLHDIGWSDEKKCRGRRRTDCISLRHGGKSETRSQKDWVHWNKGQTCRGKIGSGKEESRRTLCEGNWMKSPPECAQVRIGKA